MTGEWPALIKLAGNFWGSGYGHIGAMCRRGLITERCVGFKKMTAEEEGYIVHWGTVQSLAMKEAHLSYKAGQVMWPDRTAVQTDYTHAN